MDENGSRGAEGFCGVLNQQGWPTVQLQGGHLPVISRVIYNSTYRVPNRSCPSICRVYNVIIRYTRIHSIYNDPMGPTVYLDISRFFFTAIHDSTCTTEMGEMGRSWPTLITLKISSLFIKPSPKKRRTTWSEPGIKILMDSHFINPCIFMECPVKHPRVSTRGV